MMSLEIEPKRLPLKYTWKISRGSLDEKTNCIVSAKDGDLIGYGEASGITQPSMTEHPLIEEFHNLPKINLENIDRQVEMSSGLRFAIESALVHLEAQRNSQTVTEYLQVKQVESVQSSYSLPIMAIQDIAAFINDRELHRFSALKVKIGDQNQTETIAEVLSNYKGPIRIDANEAFESTSAVLKFLDCIDLNRIEFIEQPLPRDQVQSYLELRKQVSLPVIADESIQSQPLTQQLVDQFDGINVKLMKSGGYFRALEQLAAARSQGMKTMLGCMVETSLGIWSAMNIADNIDWYDLDGFLFFKQDPFDLVREENGVISRVP